MDPAHPTSTAPAKGTLESSALCRRSGRLQTQEARQVLCPPTQRKPHWTPKSQS